jgi:pSer/pThr/pTyr-binding forkhead associated (FHA) protein
MASIKVFHKGALVSNFSLDGLKECRIGRDSSADIILQNDGGVSRLHLLIKWIDNGWTVECTAKSKLLFKDGNQISSLRLSDGDRFSIPGYEFEFQSGSENQSTTKSNISIEDKTSVGMLPSIPALVRYDEFGQVLNTITLSGNAWIVGRDTTNSIFIDHPKLSRKHFEIIRKEGRFLIRDLGSANGTFVNGKTLTQNEWVYLYSGDEISVFDLKLRFVLRDASFDDRVQEAKNLLSPFLSANDQGPVPESNPSSGSSSDSGLNNEASANSNLPPDNLNKLKRVKFIRLAIGVIVVLSAILYFLMDTNPESSESESAKILSPFDKLTPEQKANVRQLYQSAQNFLQQGKYELARQEIIKLHQIIPFYEDSKQIEETANQGIAMLQEKERLEAEAREREAIQEKIKSQIVKCRAIINPKIEMFEMDLCLAPVLEFDPDNPEMKVLKAEVQKIIDERAQKETERRIYAEKVAKLKKMFEEAQDLDQKEDWHKAISAYEKVVGSFLPDPNSLKARSKARSEELQQMLLIKQTEAEKKAEEAYKKGDLKGAIKIIRDGILINQENQVILGRHEEWMNELKRSMMPIYQEAILEESVGDVESAKIKWQKIKELSLPGEDYYEKAKVKLKKYGAWK